MLQPDFLMDENGDRGGQSLEQGKQENESIYWNFLIQPKKDETSQEVVVCYIVTTEWSDSLR